MSEIFRSFALDCYRVYVRRLSGNRLTLFLEIVAQPLAVAVVVLASYLARQEVEPFADTFLYFSGLYAFWVGLFGLCQSVNRELQNGEWRYWVLGLRRRRVVHLLAVFAAGLSLAAIQVALFVGCVVGISACDQLLGGQMLYHFTEMFVSTSSQASPLFQMGGMLRIVSQLQFGSVVGPVVYALAFFSASLSLALVSGAGFGFAFSAWIREPTGSLNVSVGFVVTVGMLTLCGLRGINQRSSSADKVDSAFLPGIEQEALVAAGKSVEPKTCVRHISRLARLLPQRYFFNIGRLTFDRKLKNAELGILAKVVGGKENDGRVVEWLKTDPGGGYVRPRSHASCFDLPVWIGDEATEEWRKECQRLYSLVGEEQDDDLVREGVTSRALWLCVSRRPEVKEKWAIDLWRQLMWRGAMRELSPLVLIFLSCMLSAVMAVYLKEVYYDLR